MPIPNPNPITPGVFNSLWAAFMDVNFSSGALRATMCPFDGANLMQTGQIRINRLLHVMRQDTESAAVLNALQAEAARQAGCPASEVLSVTVRASDLAKPVVATIRFATRNPHVIGDCFALAASDEVFGGVLQGTLNELARHV